MPLQGALFIRDEEASFDVQCGNYFLAHLKQFRLPAVWSLIIKINFFLSLEMVFGICQKEKWRMQEAIEVAAVREVEEECGIRKPTLISKLLVTYHTYDTYGENCIKPTHWYLMQYDGAEDLLPQEEEGITNVQWVNREDIASKMLNTYGSIIDVIGAFKNNKE